MIDLAESPVAGVGAAAKDFARALAMQPSTVAQS